MKHIRTSVFLSLLLIISMGCSLFSFAQKGPSPTGDEPVESLATANPNDDSGEAVIVDASEFVPIHVDLPVLGKVNFRADTTRSVSVDFPADGNDVTLELTDAAGLTWKLIVPGLALAEPITLKMTSLTEVKSDEISGEYMGGILLEPDGLQFRVPANLTVDGEGLSEDILFLTGDQHGSAMNLTLPGETKNSAQIEHFSSLVANDTGHLRERQTLEQLGEKLDKMDQETIDMVKKFLKEHRNDLEVPVPPSVHMGCGNEEKQKADNKVVDTFVTDAMEPEGVLIRSLMKIRMGKELLGRGADSPYTLELRLLYRLEKKARLLMETYRGQPDKLVPITRFALEVARQIELLGEQDELLAQIGQWVADAIDPVINDIIDKHDYSQVSVVMEISRWAQLMGNESKTLEFETIARRLEGALKFQIQPSMKYSTLDSLWELGAEFPLKPMATTGGNGFIWQGNGQGHVSYTFTQSGNVTAETHGFPVNAYMTNFDVCEGRAVITIDRFYGSSETLLIEELPPATRPYTQTAWEYSFRNYKGGTALIGEFGGDGYIFPVSVRNLDATAVDETVKGETNCGDKCSVEFQIKLIHTPERIK